MGGVTLGACASGIAGYGGTVGHCPPLAPSARNGASPHHARGPLVSTSAAAARCLPLLPLPAAASRVASAGERSGLSRVYRCRLPRGEGHEPGGWGPKTGRCQGNHSRRAYMPSCCPPSTLAYTHSTLCLPTRPSVTRPQLSLLSLYSAPPPPPHPTPPHPTPPPTTTTASCWHPATNRATPSWSSCWKILMLQCANGRTTSATIFSPQLGLPRTLLPRIPGRLAVGGWCPAGWKSRKAGWCPNTPCPGLPEASDAGQL